MVTIGSIATIAISLGVILLCEKGLDVMFDWSSKKSSGKANKLKHPELTEE